MNTLYISDLDGTLLNKNAEVSVKTSQIINTLSKKGLKFSFATARTASSAVQITKTLDINVPCVLMNGVSIYDIKAQKYIKNEFIHSDDAISIAEIFKRHNLHPFMYKIEEDMLYAIYTGFSNDSMKDFFQLRRDKYDKPFLKCDDFKNHTEQNVVYFTILDSFEILSPVKAEIEKIKSVKFAFYKDVYHPEYWFLEIFSGNASKYNAVDFIGNYCGFDNIIGFGDNLNDIPLFEACNKKIAVENAKNELKNIADLVIGNNDSDSVALWINENFLNERN